MALRNDEQREAVRDRRIARLDRRWYRRVAATLFILYNITAVSIWLLPGSSGISNGLLNYVRPYMTSTGLMQNWAMFAPNPDQTDAYLQANILLYDGQTVVYTFPRMASMGYIEKYREERYRKFVENARNGPMYWPFICQWLAREHKDQSPVEVDLYRFTRPIPDIGVPFGSFNSVKVLAYKVTKEDLQ